jgi:hypothetical protein
MPFQVKCPHCGMLVMILDYFGNVEIGWLKCHTESGGCGKHYLPTDKHRLIDEKRFKLVKERLMMEELLGKPLTNP